MRVYVPRDACCRVVDTLRQLQTDPQRAGSQPKHIVCCVTNRTPQVNAREIFGFGVTHNLSTPAEIICAGAFEGVEGRRRVRSTQNVEISFFLPVWVDEAHWSRAKPELFEQCLRMWKADRGFSSVLPLPSPHVIAARIICRILTNMVAAEKQAGVLSMAAGETSDCFISGYFSVLRLLKQLTLEHADIAVYANETWTNFVNVPQTRLKSKCLNIGDLLPLLCVTSQGVDWNFVKHAYVEESNLRHVKWCAAALPLSASLYGV